MNDKYIKVRKKKEFFHQTAMQYLYYLILAVCYFFESNADCGKSSNVQHWKNIFERADNLRHVKVCEIHKEGPWDVCQTFGRRCQKLLKNDACARKIFPKVSNVGLAI